MKTALALLLLPLAVTVAQIDIGIQDIACNATTRPAILDGNEPWVIGPFDYSYANLTHAPNMLCEWHIFMDDAEDIIELKFLFFEVEMCSECKCDHVSVWDGPSDASPLIGTYCGLDQIPASVFSTGTHLFVRWESDATFEYRGFLASYGHPYEHNACEVDQAPEIIERQEGILFSPEWPELYPAGIACDWLFQAPPGQHVRFTFFDFNLDDRCSVPIGDRLDLHNGPTALSPRMIRMFGQNIQPHIIESSSNSVFARFITSQGIRYRGFFLVWEFIDRN